MLEVELIILFIIICQGDTTTSHHNMNGNGDSIPLDHTIYPLRVSQLFLRGYCILIGYGKQVWADVSKAAEVCRPLGY